MPIKQVLYRSIQKEVDAHTDAQHPQCTIEQPGTLPTNTTHQRLGIARREKPLPITNSRQQSHKPCDDKDSLNNEVRRHSVMRREPSELYSLTKDDFTNISIVVL